MLGEIIKYKDLLFMLTLRDIRIRYKQAAMGLLWALFMPIVAVLAGVIIKKVMAVISGKLLDLSSMAAISIKVLPWTFFVSSIKFSVQSLVGNANLVTKIYFPREVLPLASILACLFDLLIAVAALSIVLIFVNIGVSIYLLLLPALLIFLVLFTSGLGLFLASANLFYRDIKYVVEIILMFGIFFTPVFYDTNMFGNWQTLLLINPLSSILEAVNSIVILHRMPSTFWLAYAGAVSFAIFIFGMVVFHKSEPLFAENI